MPPGMCRGDTELERRGTRQGGARGRRPAASGGGVLTDSVLSGGVIVASHQELAVNMLLAAWYW
jgi:hypothetical protein